MGIYMKKRLFTILVLLCILMPLMGADSVKPKLAVVQFSVNDSQNNKLISDAVAARNLVQSNIVKSGRFDVIARDEIDKILENQEIQSSSISSSESLKKLKLMNISYLVTGNVDAIDNYYQVSISILDVTNGRFVFSDDEFMENSAPEVNQGIKILITRFIESLSSNAEEIIVERPNTQIANTESDSSTSTSDYVELGKKAYMEKDYETAFEYFSGANSITDPEALYMLGLIYENGYTVPKNYTKSIECYVIASINGFLSPNYLNEKIAFFSKIDADYLKAKMQANPNAEIEENFLYLITEAQKNYKTLGKPIPSPMTIRDILISYPTELDFISSIESHYYNYTTIVHRLSGGLRVIVKVDLDYVISTQGYAVVDETALCETAMSQVIECLTNRIDKYGIVGSVIRQQDKDHISIELPFITDSNKINSIILGKSILSFRQIDFDATNTFQEYYSVNIGKIFATNGELLNPDVIPSDSELLGYYKKDANGINELVKYMVVKKYIVLDGKYIKSAAIAIDNITGEPEVHLILDSEGTKIFGDFTASHIGESISIISDDKIKFYAKIREAIPGGNVSISGFNLEEAQNLQEVLQTAWLSIPLSVESLQIIDIPKNSILIDDSFFD